MYFDQCYVESDGRGIANAKDPPGQRCIYIQPGSPERENYRLFTYEQFPKHVPVDTRQLSSCGFYYTGFKDRVKCFSCGQCVDNWTLGDIASDPQWHAVNCKFVQGTDPTNVPMFTSRFTQKGPRFATNISRSTQHGGSSSNSSGGSVVMNTQIHAESNPENQLLNSQQDITRFATTSTPNPLFPCNNPLNPHMENKELRLQTFSYGNEWPRHRITATPEQIAEAGLFYLGSRDRVKCWYCNGGLQNWDTSDDPWFEHAKWFPQCEFVLKSKGVEFVQNVCAAYPNMSRPLPPNNSQANLPSTSQSRRPDIIDPQSDKLNRQTRVVTEAMETSVIVTGAKAIGFAENEIKDALTKQYQTRGRLFGDVTSLVNALLGAQSSRSNYVDDIDTNPQSEPPENAASNATTIGSDLTDRIQHLEAQKLCKVCGSEKANVVLMPCGHLASCLACSGKIQKCPVCSTRIIETINCFSV